MTINNCLSILKAHGLYVSALTDKTIALMDCNGNVYDTVIFDSGMIIDRTETMPLRTWLGY